MSPAQAGLSSSTAAAGHLCVPWCFSPILAVREGLFWGFDVEPLFELLDLEQVWLKLTSPRPQQRMKMLSPCWLGEYSLKGCSQPLPPVPPVFICS